MIPEIILLLTAIYGIAGFLFALAFVIKGVQRVDEAAAGAGIGFRLIIIPGAMVFWPFLLKKWRKAAPSVMQKSALPNLTLRRRHRQIWILLGILLPLGIITSWLVIPPQPITKLLTAGIKDRLPELVRSVDRKDYRIRLRSDKERTHWQLEWENKTVLAVPSAIIYRVPDAASNPKQTAPPDTAANPTKTTPPQTAAPSGSAIPGTNELIGRIEARGAYLFPLKEDSSNYKMIRLLLYDFIHQKQIDAINF